MNKAIMKKIKEFALHLDWDIAFGGKSKGNRHLFRVEKIAVFLAKKEGANLDIVRAGAWLHDVGLIKGNTNHPINGSKIAKKFLKKLKIKQDLIAEICHCIEAHEGNIKAKTKEAMVVHDADVLDKMGPLGIIRETWKEANLGIPTEKICKNLKKVLKRRERKLYTQTAKKVALTLNSGLEEFFANLNKQLKLKWLKEAYKC